MGSQLYEEMKAGDVPHFQAGMKQGGFSVCIMFVHQSSQREREREKLWVFSKPSVIHI